jgi:hypothetical protein
MKKIIIAILLIGGCLLVGTSYMHYKGYDRMIAHKIYHLIQGKHGLTNQTKEYYSVTFNDLNKVHLSSAKKLGLKHPLKNRADANVVKDRLVKIKSNKRYTVDKLTHSIPYLTDGAAELLEMIGQNFIDSLDSKGLKSNKIIVTSVLRTQEDVKKLQESGNVNASSNSAHCYGTTFDITYARYAKKTEDKNTLKIVLGEVLLDLKKQKKCYVKYEEKQKCFHITTRI